MTEQRYIVAKYAPDVMRMEPRNIGVVVWSRGRVACRFLDAADAEFVTDSVVYERWVKYWSAMISAGKVSLDELMRTQKGNYLLCDAGRIETDIADVGDATDFLFGELVVTHKRREKSNQSRLFAEGVE